MDNEIIDINQAEIRQIPTQTQTQLASHTDTGIISDFRRYFKMASELCKADIIPQAYKGKVAVTSRQLTKTAMCLRERQSQWLWQKQRGGLPTLSGEICPNRC